MCINWLWIRQLLIKEWDKKLIIYIKIVQSRPESDVTSEKTLNDNTQKANSLIKNKYDKKTEW